MSFYVYKALKGRGLQYPNNWELRSTHADYMQAEQAARKLCPRHYTVETEPGNNLPRGFFGANGSEKWTAMIDTKDIHK